MNVLSVDWDYFFPNSKDYDWGHSENLLFYEHIWNFRILARNIFHSDHKFAFEEFKFNERLARKFWDSVIFNVPSSLTIAESHSDLFHVLESLDGKATVYNFDAHHDFGYPSDQPGIVECGNWAFEAIKTGLIKEYNLVYPYWRTKYPEHGIENLPFKIYYKMPVNHPRLFHHVFICRSSCWTPPWYDRKWLKFIGWWGRYTKVWIGKRSIPQALRTRSPDMKSARKFFNDFRKSELGMGEFLCKNPEIKL